MLFSRHDTATSLRSASFTSLIVGSRGSRGGGGCFLWLSVPGRADRGYLESSSIALLSCLTGGTDEPSASWLGRHAERPEIRASGVWNVQHVSGHYEPAFLRRLAQFVDQQA